jgi:hypothetical protein
MNVGEIYLSDSCSVWNTTSNQSPGIVIDYLKYNEIVLLLSLRGEELQVLTPRGKIGWVNPRSDGKARLHETTYISR